jgi:predicted transcriptional regulator
MGAVLGTFDAETRKRIIESDPILRLLAGEREAELAPQKQAYEEGVGARETEARQQFENELASWETQQTDVFETGLKTWRSEQEAAFENMYTILKRCTKHTKKVHVPAQVNLDEQQLGKYLDFLAGLDFLTIHDGECGTTEKGRRFIRGFEDLSRVLGEENAIGGE